MKRRLAVKLFCISGSRICRGVGGGGLRQPRAVLAGEHDRLQTTFRAWPRSHADAPLRCSGRSCSPRPRPWITTSLWSSNLRPGCAARGCASRQGTHVRPRLPTTRRNCVRPRTSARPRSARCSRVRCRRRTTTRRVTTTTCSRSTWTACLWLLNSASQGEASYPRVAAALAKAMSRRCSKGGDGWFRRRQATGKAPRSVRSSRRGARSCFAGERRRNENPDVAIPSTSYSYSYTCASAIDSATLKV